ncbi:MAG TPA: tRNA (adenosine(37)-N6)-threonylcarbamoyltransferase complex ATPase subunit type 1 TsaE [Dehalococcoidia bacterium]|jgi:tRNA threonylcarbamoyladenosine biosynthesis protein TsaE|nr:tRNA (adenosine(37)-N6)-threonylcarbamoyltransferase complex ATPase subunit type 1 TsaE [Dehalococcoidia bacterium]
MISTSPEQTRQLGRELGGLAQAGDVYLLVGKLGTGKTCLTQGVAWGLGIEEYASSPSFVVVKEYRGRLPLYHIDLYRIDHLNEVMDLGLDDYLYGRGVSVVEWAERGLEAMPGEHLLVEIESLSARKRRFRLQPRGQRYVELVERWLSSGARW